jgi:ABC-type branched-subunit amino acid transport system ATPase component
MAVLEARSVNVRFGELDAVRDVGLDLVAGRSRAGPARTC